MSVKENDAYVYNTYTGIGSRIGKTLFFTSHLFHRTLIQPVYNLGFDAMSARHLSS